MAIESVDVLIIGAGPSGTVAASMVHKSGLKAKIVEKAKFPRFVIGESLLPRCMENIVAAGLLEAVERKEFRKKRGAKFLMADKSCELNFCEQYTDGWEWTWQAPRADFDKTLADEVEAKGIEIAYQTGVTGIEFNGSDSITTVEDKDGNISTIEAKFIIDSSGYGRVIPKLLNLDYPSKFPPKSSIFSHFKEVSWPNEDDNSRTIAISGPPDAPYIWIWVIPFSNGNTSVGFVGDIDFFDKVPGTPSEKLIKLLESSEHIRDMFRGAEMVFEPQMITGYAIGVKQLYGDGFALTGNSAEFLDPIFSSGVTFATESGALAAKLACKQLKGEEVNWETEYTKYIMEGVDTFRSYVEAWYNGTFQKIIFAPNINAQHKNKICSVLAGYVWDRTNPFVKKHNRILKTLGKVVDLEATL